jgi:hypothetical protein
MTKSLEILDISGPNLRNAKYISTCWNASNDFSAEWCRIIIMRDIQFVAGFFDANGYVSYNRRTYRGVKRAYRGIRLLFYSHNQTVLEEIQRIIGRKKRNVNVRKKPSGKLSFYLAVSDRQTLNWLVPELLELCVVKKSKLRFVNRFLKVWQQEKQDIAENNRKRFSSRLHWTQEDRRNLRNYQTRHMAELLEIFPDRSVPAIKAQLRKMKKSGRLK